MESYLKERDGLENIDSYTGRTIVADIYLDSNENPYPMPKAVDKEISEKLQNLNFNRYPKTNIQKVIASDLGLKPENILIGNGSSQLLEVCCKAFGGIGRKIAFPEPSFSMYKTYAFLADSIPAPFSLNKDFQIDVENMLDFLQKEKPSILILCNPNNPTGTINEVEGLLQILDAAKCVVLLDEAYMEFADQSLLSYLSKYDNLVILKTFSKAYGLAGLRVGYLACSNENIVKTINKAVLPYSVNQMSLLVAQTVYENKEKYQDLIKEIIEQREYVSKQLLKLGFTVYPSKTNFVMCNLNSSKEEGEKLFDFLLENKVLVRNFSKNPLLKGSLRITIGTKQENDILLEKIKEYCKKK